jgi:Protein of unknown function (DUF2905)
VRLGSSRNNYSHDGHQRRKFIFGADVFRFASFVCVRSDMRELGKLIVIIGVVATLVGLVLWTGFAPKWLGRLPGDVRIEREHSSFYFPIVTCIVLSIVISLVLSLLSMFRR